MRHVLWTGSAPSLPRQTGSRRTQRVEVRRMPLIMTARNPPSTLQGRQSQTEKTSACHCKKMRFILKAVRSYWRYLSIWAMADKDSYIKNIALNTTRLEGNKNGCQLRRLLPLIKAKTGNWTKTVSARVERNLDKGYSEWNWHAGKNLARCPHSG